MQINNNLIAFYKVLDYVPLASSVSNFIDLFHKYVILPRQKEETINQDRYYTHIEQKSFLRCVVLLIPVLGNVVIGICDFIYERKKKSILLSFQTDYYIIPRSSFREIQKDKDFLLKAIGINFKAIAYAFYRLHYDKEFLLNAIEIDDKVIDFFQDKSLTNDKEFMLEAIKRNAAAITYIGRLLQNEEFILAAIRKNVEVFEYIKKDVRESYINLYYNRQ